MSEDRYKIYEQRPVEKGMEMKAHSKLYILSILNSWEEGDTIVKFPLGEGLQLCLYRYTAVWPYKLPRLGYMLHLNYLHTAKSIRFLFTVLGIYNFELIVACITYYRINSSFF